MPDQTPTYSVNPKDGSLWAYDGKQWAQQAQPLAPGTAYSVNPKDGSPWEYDGKQWKPFQGLPAVPGSSSGIPLSTDKPGLLQRMTNGVNYMIHHPVETAVDVGTAGPRAVIGLGKDIVHTIGGIGEAAVAKGEMLATHLPGGPSAREVEQMRASGQVMDPRLIAQATENLAPSAPSVAPHSPESHLVAPQTGAGQVADVGAQTGLLALEAAATGGTGLTGAGAKLNAGLAFGAQGYGEAYDRATRAGYQNPGQYAIANGLLNAGAMTIPMSEAGEGVLRSALGKTGLSDIQKTVLAKTGTVLTEAEAFTVAQNAVNRSIDPKTGMFNQAGLLQNLAMVGAGKIYGTVLKAQQQEALSKQPLATFEAGRKSSIPGRIETPKGAEQEFMGLGSENQGDQALAMSYLSRLNAKYSPEVREEVTHYLSDDDAGVKPQPLSTEGQALLNDPLFKQMQSDMQTRYAEHNKLTGSNNEARPNYVPRFVTEGVETTQTTPGAARMSQTATNLKARDMMSFVDPDGNVTVGSSSGRDSFVGSSGEKIKSISLDDALSDVKKVRDSFNKRLADLGLSRANDYFNSISTEVQKKVDAVSDIQRQISEIPQDIETGMPHDASGEARFQRLTQKLAYAQEDARQAISALVAKAVIPPEELAGIMISNDPKAHAIASVIDAAQDKINEAYAKYGNQDGNLYRMGDKLVTRRQATIREIESQTPVRYRKDAVQDMAQGLVQLGKANRNIDFVNSLKQSGLTTDGTGSDVPKGWVKLSPETQQKFGPVADQVMHPDLARVFEEASKAKVEPTKVKRAIQSVINFGFTFNPVAHTANQLDHFVGSLSPDELVDGLFSGKLQAAMDKGSSATQSILNGEPNADAVRFLRSGGTNLLSSKITQPYREGIVENNPSVNTRAYMQEPTLNMNKDMAGQTPLSTKYTWGPDQTARMSLAFFKEANGMPLAEAIKEVNRSYPDYSNPVNRIEGATDTNAALHAYADNPNALFQRYTLGKFGTAGNALLDALSGKPGKLITKVGAGLPKYGGLGLALGALIKQFTQNQQMEYRGGGTGKVMGELGAAAQENSATPLLRSNFILDPASSLLMNAIRGDITGRGMVNPSDMQDFRLAMDRGDLSTASKHAGNYLGDLASGLARTGLMAATNAQGAVTGKMSGPEALTRTFLGGTKDYTDAERLTQQYFAEHAPRVPPNANTATAFADKLRLANALKNDDLETASQIAEGGNLSQKEAENLYAKWAGNSRTKALSASVSRMPFDDAARVLASSNEDEKKVLLPLVQNKLMKAVDAVSKSGNDAQVARLKEAMVQYAFATGKAPASIPIPSQSTLLAGGAKPQ